VDVAVVGPVTQVCLLVAGQNRLNRVAVMMTLNPSISSCPLKLNKHSGTFHKGGEKLLARFSRVPLKYAEIIFDKSATDF